MRDLNPHCPDFESGASASWANRASRDAKGLHNFLQHPDDIVNVNQLFSIWGGAAGWLTVDRPGFEPGSEVFPPGDLHLVETCCGP